MAITIKHAKTDTIADWTQADLDAQIAAGNYPVGTLISDIVLPSDWNNDHTFSGVAASGDNSDITSLSGITGGISSPDYLQLDTTAAASIALGKLRWNTDNATAAFGIIDGTTEVNIGEQMYAYVTNAESVTITAGQAVYLYQATGNRASVKLAYNLGDATSAKTLGLVTQDIAAGATGFVTTQGVLAKINTSAFAEGDTLYLGATAGSLTNVKPKAPNHLVYIGVVERANAGNGQIYVRPQNGYELDEIHDVQINSPANGQTIIYDASTSLWKNANLTAGTGISITNGASSITITNSSPNTYDPTNVAITGGTINNTSIGATTASTGKFTSVTTPSVTATTTDLTLSATGSIINSFGAGSFTTSYLSGGTQTNAIGYGNFNLSSTLGGSIRFYTTNLSTQQFNISHTASAVNYVQVTGSATGAAASSLGGLLFTGSDTSPNFAITTKGAGYIAFCGNASTNNQSFRISNAYVANTGNLLQVQAVGAGLAPSISPISGPSGTDTNISMAFQPKGTGAIDLAAGSSGVNISNGGTVTAITRTVAGSAYTSLPTMAISAPTTAGGVQATATFTMGLAGVPTITSGGTGYTVGDTLTFVGGTGGASALTVSTVSAGVITGVTIGSFGLYSALPSNPISVTGGTGTGATFTATWAINSVFTITNAGSGYIEQPTVSFSGGGGSGAAAYASVGSAPTFKALGGSQLNIATSGGTNFAISDSGLLNPTTYAYATGGSGSAGFGVISGNANAGVTFTSKGTSAVSFYTNSYASLGLLVSHTASAVNYVQVTGSATGNITTISAQGSDTNTYLALQAKGSGYVAISNATLASYQAFRVSTTNAINTGNLIQVVPSVSGSSPSIQAISGTSGTDANIDLALTPKGTGVVQFGSYTATVLTPTGYVTIKTSDGTTRRLLVG